MCHIYFTPTTPTQNSLLDNKPSKTDCIDISDYLPLKAKVKLISLLLESAETETEKMSEDDSSKAKQIQCKLCKKVLSSSSSVRRHVKYVHEGVNQFECNICSKRFQRNYIFQAHLKTVHENSKELLCNICNNAFTHSRLLQNHVRIVHENIREFQCNICKNVLDTRAL